jgi:hypothetical protein
MAANIEVTGFGRRHSFAPLVVLLVFTAVIAMVYVATRPVPISSERAESVSSFGLGRDALVASGYTGRLGGVAYLEWRPAAGFAGFTGRLGAATESSPEDWTARAVDAGFTGRLGAASAGSSDWTERAEEAGFTGRLGG